VATGGTALSQSHPDSIEFLQTLKADVRIFNNDGTLFHPKVYLFSSAGSVALFIGSSNLTFSA
jgi:HKD family nuclease